MWSYNFAGEFVLWSSSSTQYFFNIDHSAVTTLRESTKLENSIIPTLVPSMKSQEQQNMANIETVTIAQLFEAQLPDGKNVRNKQHNLVTYNADYNRNLIFP